MTQCGPPTSGHRNLLRNKEDTRHLKWAGFFFPFHDPFAMRSTISAALITICKANRPQTIRYIRLNRTKPTCGFLLFYFYLRAGKLWPCQRQESSQSGGTAIELGVRLEIESQTKRGCHKKGWQRKPHKSMQTRAQMVNSHLAYGKWKSWASLQVGCLSPSFPPALCINL